jgi:hypothetical protein
VSKNALNGFVRSVGVPPTRSVVLLNGTTDEADGPEAHSTNGRRHALRLFPFSFLLLPWALIGAMAVVAESNCAEEKATPPVPAPVLLKSYDGGEGNYRGSPVVVDLNGDGKKEIITTQWGAVLVHTPDGKRLHELKVTGRVYSGAIVGDIDGDKRFEVITGDNQGNLHVWRADGTPVAGFPQKVRLDADIRQIAAADLDGDGKDEIVVYSSLTDHGCEPNMYVFQADGSVRKGWPHFFKEDPFLGKHFDHAGGFNNSLAVGDVDGDRKMELVFCQDYGSICLFKDDGTPCEAKGQQVLSKKSGPVWWGECRAWVPQTSEKLSWGPEKKYLLEFTYSPPLIADLDLDGKPEILAVPNLESPQKIGPIIGSVLIVRNADFTPKTGFAPWKLSDESQREGKFEANPCVVAGDIAGDARLEVLVVHLDGTLRAYGPDGTDLWTFKYADTGAIVPSEPLLADVTGDGKADVIFTASDSTAKTGRLLVLDGAGRLRLDFPLPYHNQAAPTLADVNGDGVPELIVAAFNKGASKHSVFVYAWPVNPKCVPWPTGRGDFGHTACVRPAPANGGNGGGVIKEDKPEPKKPPPPPAPAIKPEALAAWNQKLTERVVAGLKNGQRPSAFLRVMSAREERVQITGADAKSLTVNLQNNDMPVPWNKLGNADRLSLAQSFLVESSAADHVLVAVFALASGRADLADTEFAKEEFPTVDRESGGGMFRQADRESGAGMLRKDDRETAKDFFR